MALKKCRECKAKVSSKAQKCPHCGAPIKRNSRSFTVGCLLIFLIFSMGTFFLMCAGFLTDVSQHSSTNFNSDWESSDYSSVDEKEELEETDKEISEEKNSDTKTTKKTAKKEKPSRDATEQKQKQEKPVGDEIDAQLFTEDIVRQFLKYPQDAEFKAAAWK